MLRTLLFLLAASLGALLPASTGASPSASPVLPLGETAPALAGHVEALLDPGRTLTLDDVLDPAVETRFSPVQTDPPSFGFIPDRVWLRARVRNALDVPRAWVIDFNMNFMQGIEAWIVRADGTAEILLHQDLASPFPSRIIPTDQLAARFALAPGETATLYVAYWSGGATALPLEIVSEADFVETATVDTAKVFAFYGMMLLLATAGLISAIVTRQPIFLAYVAYALSLALYLAQMDGAAFHYLWPGAPAWNGFATLPLGAAVVAFSALYVRAFLRRYPIHPLLRGAVVALAATAVLILALSAVVDTQLLKQVILLVASLSPIVFVAAGASAARTSPREVRFFIIGWSAAVLSGLSMIASHMLGLSISRSFALDSIRTVVVFEASMMGLAIIDRFSQLREASYRSLQTANEALRERIALQDRLAALEIRYGEARTMAEARGQRLADAAHDLRQPIHALRMSLHGMLSGAPENGSEAPGKDTIERSFTYLEGMLADYLASADPDAEPAGKSLESEQNPVQDVLDGIHGMFAADAEAAGMELRLVPTSARMSASPLKVMRIVSNLVSNALKYAATGRILVGCRHVGGNLAIEVHDEGPGLTPDQYSEAAARTARLDAAADGPEGHGLGLSIALKAAEEIGATLEHLPRPGGAGFRLLLPSG